MNGAGNPETVLFKPRRSFNRIWIIMAGFGVFIPIGIILYVITGNSQALIMSAFGIVPVVYLLYRVLSPGSIYSVGGDGGLSAKRRV